MASEYKDSSLLEKLRFEIQNAIVKYKKTCPLRARNAHRSADILAIQEMLRVATNPETLLIQLEDYFNSNTYYTGLRDKSVLENLIAKAVITIDKESQQGLNTFGYSPKDYLRSDQTPADAIDEDYKLRFSFKDFIDFAIDKYEGEKWGSIPEHRAQEIKKIREILADKSLGQEEARRQVTDKIAFLSHSFNSSLKKYLHEALFYYNNYDTKTFHTRIWKHTPADNPKKILLFLHGWHDSVNSANELAREAVKEGFEVIAYDHRGHGNDAQRNMSGISSDFLRIDFRVFLRKCLEKNPKADIALVGHSMGGAILATENAYINKQSAVKTVSLLAPAVMSSLHKMINPVKLLYRNMHPDVQKAQKASDRFGGEAPSLWGLLNFMRKAWRALNHLFLNKDSSRINWHIYSGKKDASINYTEFEALNTASPKKKLTFFSRGDHALQFGHHSGNVNRTLLKDLSACFIPDGDFIPESSPL